MKYGHVCDMVQFQDRVSSLEVFYNDIFVNIIFKEVSCRREGRHGRVVCLLQAHLFQMIVHSVFTVSSPSCGAPLVLT